MDEYEVGYGKPPKGTRFRPGTSGNPKGRPKHIRSPLGEIVKEVLDSPIRYRENGRGRTAARREVMLKMLVKRAINGDTAAAELLLKKRAHALQHAVAHPRQIVVTGCLPDPPGQTGKRNAQNKGSDVDAEEGADTPDSETRAPRAGDD